MSILKNLLFGIAAIGIISIQSSDSGDAECLFVNKKSLMNNLNKSIQRNNDSVFSNYMGMNPLLDEKTLTDFKKISKDKQGALERGLKDEYDPSDKCMRVKCGLAAVIFLASGAAVVTGVVEGLLTDSPAYGVLFASGMLAPFAASYLLPNRCRISAYEDALKAQSNIQEIIDQHLQKLESSDGNITPLGSDENV